jgi:hypothetical protein
MLQRSVACCNAAWHVATQSPLQARACSSLLQYIIRWLSRTRPEALRCARKHSHCVLRLLARLSVNTPARAAAHVRLCLRSSFWERLVHLEAATKAAQTCTDELNTLKVEFARVRLSSPLRTPRRQGRQPAGPVGSNGVSPRTGANAFARCRAVSG